jgi:hypothetical protein
MALLPTEKTWGKNKKDIKYLNRDFASLRQALIEFTRTYYADTFNDFNEASPGMMFLEQAAYVGDVLSYYTDAQLKESFINLAGNYKNIITQAQNLGYKPKLSKPATTTITVYQTIPTIGVGANNRPDYTYAVKIKQGMQIASKNSQNVTFITTDDVDFNDPTDREVTVFQTSGNEASLYLLTKKVKAISANVITKDFTVGEFQKNPVFTIEDASFIGIDKVVDKFNGSVYYEVPYLAQEMVYSKIPNVESNDPELSQYRSTVPYLLKLLKTPRRFTTKIITNSIVELRFGGGSANVSDEILIPSTKNVGLGLNNSIDKLGETFDPSNFLKTSTYGIAPSNTVLEVIYLSGGGIGANVPVADLVSIQNIEFDEDLLQFTPISLPQYNAAKASVAVTNLEPAVGGGSAETLEEIRENAIANYASQNRAVTRKDYEIRTLAMSPEFGSIAKVFVAQDTALDDTKVQAVLRDDTARQQFLNLVKSSVGKTDTEIGDQIERYILQQKTINAEFNNPFAINMYLLGYDVNGNLTVLNDAIRQNIKTYLEEYRMLTDAVNMLDGFVINIGLNYEITTFTNYNKREVLLKVNNALKNLFDISKWQINQPINLSEIELEIANIDGVASVQNVEIINLRGGNYSTYAYNIKEATRNKIIYPSLDPAIFEIKYPNTDIKGRAL